MCVSVFCPHVGFNICSDRVRGMISLMSDCYKVTASTYRDRELIKVKERVMEWRRGRADLSLGLNNEPTDGGETLLSLCVCEQNSSQTTSPLKSKT